MKQKRSKTNTISEPLVEVYLPKVLPSYFSKADEPKIETFVAEYIKLLFNSIYTSDLKEINFSLKFSDIKFPMIMINNQNCRLPGQTTLKAPNIEGCMHLANYCCEGIFQNRALFLTTENIETISGQTNNGFKEIAVENRLKICRNLVQYCHSLSWLQLFTKAPEDGALQDTSGWFETIIDSVEALSLKIETSGDLQNTWHPADLISKEDLFISMNEDLFYECGIYSPFPVFSENKNLAPAQFQIWLNDLPFPILNTIGQETFLCDIKSDRIDQNMNDPGIRNYANYNSAFSQRKMSEFKNITPKDKTWGTWGLIKLYLNRVILENSGIWMNKFVVQQLLYKMDSNPKLKDLFLKKFDIHYLTKVLRQLATEGVPIRNIKKILQGCLFAGDTINLDISKIEFLPDPTVLAIKKDDVFVPESDWKKMAELIRKVLREELSIHLTKTNNLTVLLVDLELEKSLIDSEELIAANLKEQLRASLADKLELIPDTTLLNCILVTDLSRPIIQEAIAIEYPFLKVVSYRELPPWINIVTEGRLEMV